MKSGLSFLIAAKRCEIAELQQLALTSSLVNAVGQLVHGLQRERGLSNLYLASQGRHWTAERDAQVQQCQAMQDGLLACFETLDTEAPRRGYGARLFSRIAYVHQGLDALPRLREQVQALAWTPARTSAAYVRLISGLLAVVFEAADSAPDPDISRRLVALFNFMQGKELAGQERAAGSALFAAGQAKATVQQRLLHLIESQERCLHVFGEFASPALLDAWREVEKPEHLAGLERLRRILCTTPPNNPLDANLSQAWFDACTARIDAMKTVEDRLSAELLDLCQERIAIVSRDLAAFERLRDATPPLPASAADLSFFDEAMDERPLATVGNAGQGYGPQVERSILELVQDQARRLQAVSEELDTVRASLNERKVIERAKGLLMAHRSLSEEEAHKTLRQTAMNQNRRLIEVAEAVLAMADVLPERRS